MVEGPGCKLNGEKLKKKIKGQVVNAVDGDVIDNKKDDNKNVSNPMGKLCGLKLLDVKTLGKELFAIFEDDVCLRVHFLMDGYIRFNSESREYGNAKTHSPKLKLQMTKDEVNFFECSVIIRSAAECVKKHEELYDLDICSPTFDAKRATDAVMEQPERLICDVILDQLILPGVGNIIKNEALFNAGINPISKVKQLSAELVAFLVKMTRDFTAIFYQCRKQGYNLRKHMKVYEKEECVECGKRITKCKPGEYERVTFFCSACQRNTKSAQKVPVKSSLLGWISSSKDQVPWNCQACTLENKPGSTKCNVCLTPKDGDPKSVFPAYDQSSRNSASTVSVKEEIGQNFLQSRDSVVISGCQNIPHSAINNSLPRTDMSYHSETTPNRTAVYGKYKFRRLSGTSQTGPHSLVSCQSPSSVSYARESQSIVGAKTSKSPSVANRESVIGEVKEDMKSKVLCAGHQLPAKKCRVEKNNENRGRIFYTCSLPRSKQCNYFAWGDAHHPLCAHGKIAVVRTVLKLNSNNGRSFYCCPNPKGKQCDFFQWTEAVNQ